MNATPTARRQVRWEITAPASASVYFGQDRQLCGIYTLEFARRGERYVGQTVNLLHRISSHMRRWDDIVAIGFVECASDELDELERRMIAQTQRDHPLRNRMLTKNPTSHTELDLIIDQQEQVEWLEGVAPAYPSDRRTMEAERRARTQAKFDALRGSPHYSRLLEDVAEYVHRVIPWPSVTGGTYWSMSPMPSTSRTREQRRLLTLNAHNVELVRVHEFLETGEVRTAINVAPGHVKGTGRGIWRVEQLSYRSYGVCDVAWAPLGALGEALYTPGVLTGAREMALQLMRKGPSVYAKHHSDALLDAVLLARGGDPDR